MGALPLLGCGVVTGTRYALQRRPLDLIATAAFLDGATLWLLGESHVVDPLAWAGPVCLSLGVVAQLLRGSVHARAVRVLRVLAAAGVYLTVLAQLTLDPAYGPRLLTLGLLGIGVGVVLKIRDFVDLGLTAMGATLLWTVVRFGFTYAEFWAVYLTVIGLITLGGMLTFTLRREQILQWWSSWRARLGKWEG